MARTRITTTCSGCSETVKVDRDRATVTARRASNGVRGQRHVPAHDVVVDLDSDDEHLLMWDCPLCGHADSFDLDD